MYKGQSSFIAGVILTVRWKPKINGGVLFGR